MHTIRRVCAFVHLFRQEKFFTAIAWTPKATVQAAIGGLALDEARNLEEQRHLRVVRI